MLACGNTLRSLLLLIGLFRPLVLPTLGESTIAGRFSQQIHELSAEIDAIDQELATLPDIPQDDSGGTAAYAKYYVASEHLPDLTVESTIYFMWDEPAEVDLVALIPARKFTPNGLDPEYGFPDDYSIALIDASKQPLATIADLRSTSTSPSTRGLPYLHRPDQPVMAHGVELKIKRLRPAQARGPGIQFFALAEVFCFSGERNLMRDADISFIYDETANSSPYWSPEFMIDELTPLGLPEQPLPGGDTWKSIGWISDGKDKETAATSITIDLGHAQRIDGFRMFPSIRPSLVTVPGFGIPSRYRIEVSRDGLPNSFRTIVPPGNLDLPNPGNNPVTNRFQPVEARFVRLRPTKLWKPFQHYPAFLALSEIQILNGEENLSSSAKVTPSENPNPFPAQGQHRWSKESLTDNHGPKGKLLTRKAWLELLEERKILEITRIRLASEIRKIERRWQFFISTGLGLIGVAGLLAVIILPIRFRLRERRKIRLIRDRIAGDLHDDVGSNLGSIQLLAGTAQTKTNNKKELQLINQVAAETVTSVRDIIWLLRPKPGTRKTTIAHLRESASFLLDPIDWKLTTDLEDFALSDEDGRNLVLFFREALHNLIRHSQADSAEIRIHMNNRKLCIEIEDDGCGIPAEQLAQEKTLRALKQRSKALRAHLKIDSKIDHGTRLELTFIPQTVNGNQALRYPFPSLSK